jgi:hypothetical protein
MTVITGFCLSLFLLRSLKKGLFIDEVSMRDLLSVEAIMKSIRYGAFALIFFSSAIFAGDGDDAKAFYEASHEKYERFLENGNVREKLEAIAWMGSLRGYRFVRPLSAELLNGLDDINKRKMAAYDPYIKSRIAQSLGYIGRKEALPALTKAVEYTNAILEEERKTYEATAQKAAQEKSYDLAVPNHKTGPALMQKGYLFPVSPDGYWSTADEFKSMDFDENDEYMRIRMEGYNYVNLMHHLLVAIGDIGDPESLNVVLPFLDHPYRDVRLAAVLSAALIGGDKARDAMMARYEKETDDVVKARLCFGVLHLDATQARFYRDLIDRYLKHDDVRVRLDAASGLRELAFGESLFHLHDAFLLESHPLVKNVLLQAIHNANIDNILPPNPLFDTGPTRIWVHGEPLQPSESRR